MNSIKTFFLFISIVALLSCDKDDAVEQVDMGSEEVINLEKELRDELDKFNTDTDFTLLIKAQNGRVFSHSTGNSTELTSYQSASTSKMVTAVIILDLVKNGILSLEDSPQKYISSWQTTGNLSTIKLRHLLSFTSGLSKEALCMNLGFANFENCVEDIASQNPNSKPAGEEYYYSSSHLQVAGLMAIKAAGVSSWQELFKQFQSKTNLFPNGDYDLPSQNNPRLAGGMHWNAKEYVAFLDAFYKEQILNPDLIRQMTSDQIAGANIVYSPVSEWRYGFGTWIECNSASNNCTKTTKVSSIGAYGAYPFIDYEHKYYGIVARQGELGTSAKGYELFVNVSDKLEKWAKLNEN
jgi:CubicO group peptidase (beta-lactamase class C family)